MLAAFYAPGVASAMDATRPIVMLRLHRPLLAIGNRLNPRGSREPTQHIRGGVTDDLPPPLREVLPESDTLARSPASAEIDPARKREEVRGRFASGPQFGAPFLNRRAFDLGSRCPPPRSGLSGCHASRGPEPQVGGL